jgi:tRNA A-37 threonylcarbamoyl transferase component Bud32
MNVGTYELRDLIGEGGMGAVYRGRDPRFDRPVAIKVLHPHFQRNPDIVARFKAEAVIQAKLNHPNIVSVLDFVADDQHLAIVMEFVEGIPLDRMIEQGNGPLDPDLVVDLFGQALSGIGFAHSKGLVHRDLKPSNILVQTFDDGDLLAKIADFGVAKILGTEKLRTATTAKMGTLAYMSPEHLRSPKCVDARSDLYSLGVTLFEALTGRVPLDADTEYELMRQIVETPVPPARSLNASLPPAFDAILARATAKDPAERYQSAAAFRDALRVVTGRDGETVASAEAPEPAPKATAPAAGASSASIPASELLSLRARVAAAVGWLYWIAGTTLASQIAAILGSDWSPLLGFSIVPALASMGARGGLNANIVESLITEIVASMFVAFPLAMAILGGRGKGWAFVASLVLYGLDTLLLAADGVWLGVLLHAVALAFVLRGYLAHRTLLRQPAPPSRPTPARGAGFLTTVCGQCGGSGRTYRTGRLGAQECTGCNGRGQVA